MIAFSKLWEIVERCLRVNDVGVALMQRHDYASLTPFCEMLGKVENVVYGHSKVDGVFLQILGRRELANEVRER